MPPDRGSAAASSATVSAPHSAITPPNTQHSMMAPGAGSRPATVAGTRKMPLPMVMPIDTATALASPSERGMRSPQASAISGCPCACAHVYHGAPCNVDRGSPAATAAAGS